MNYKDALVCIPNGNAARTYPLVLGRELTGVVVESTDLRFRPGDQGLASSRPTCFQQGLRQLVKHDLTPQRGPALVTGAGGGVGSLAVSLLSRRGYTVAASTGKADAQDYLRRLGASEILSRKETEVESTRPLEAERWTGSIDTVGGATLAYLMRTTKIGGAIAASGVAGGAAFRATVFPLILRGITVLSIDLPSTPREMRRELWEEVIRVEK